MSRQNFKQFLKEHNNFWEDVGISLFEDSDEDFVSYKYLENNYYNIPTIDEKVSGIEEKFDSYYTKEETSALLNDYTNIDTFNEYKETTNETLTDLTTSVETNTREINTLSTNIENVSSKVDTLDSNVSSLSTSVDNLSTNVSTLSSNVSTLSTRVATNTSNIGSLQGEISTLSSSISTVSSEIDTLWETADSHTASISNINSELDTLTLETDTNTRDVVEVKKDLDALAEVVDGLTGTNTYEGHQSEVIYGGSQIEISLTADQVSEYKGLLYGIGNTDGGSIGLPMNYIEIIKGDTDVWSDISYIYPTATNTVRWCLFNICFGALQSDGSMTITVYSRGVLTIGASTFTSTAGSSPSTSMGPYFRYTFVKK